MYKYAAALAIVFAGFSAPSAAYADIPKCKFFEGRGLENRSVTVYEGQKMARLGYMDNKISSVNCTPGCTSTMFVDKEFQGDRIRVSLKIAIMNERMASRFDDKVSSIAVVCTTKSK